MLDHYIFLYSDKYKASLCEYEKVYIEKGYKVYDARRLAKKDVLSYLIKIDEEIQIKDGTWACPICGLHIKDMGAHVKSAHCMKWEDFVLDYSWKGSKIYFSASYRENLRKNKLNFYNNTKRGQEYRAEQSKKYSGLNNPACRDEVKLKISRSRRGQHMSIKNKELVSKSEKNGLYSDNAKSYGYTFWEYVQGKEVRFRSKCEYLVYLMFKYYGLQAEHEPFKIEYIDPEIEYTRHYMVDFVLGNRLFEVKQSEIEFSLDKKYVYVQEQLSKSNKKLEVITPDNFIEVIGIDMKIAKPRSFFENLLIDNIRQGICKLRFPVCHDIDFYANSPFIKKIGGLQEIEKGRILYENKKSY